MTKSILTGSILKRHDGAVFKVYYILANCLFYIHPADLTNPSGFQLTLLTIEDIKSNYTLI